MHAPNKIIKGTYVFFVVLYTFVLFEYFYESIQTNDLNSKIVLAALPGIIVFIQYIASSIKNSSNSYPKLNIEIITTFAKLDTLLQVEDINNYYNISRSKVNLMVFLFIVFHSVNLLLEIMTYTYQIWLPIIWFHLFVTQKMEIVNFLHIVYMLTYRLDVINKMLRTFILENRQKDVTVFIIRKKIKNTQTKNFIGSASEDNEKIRDLSAIYNIIGNNCSLTNKVYNFNLLMSLVTAFVFILVAIWQTLSLYQSSSQYDMKDIMKVTLWCCNTVFNLAALAVICEKLLRTRNKTRILVNKIIMNYDMPTTMRDQAKAFMELVEAWPLRFFVYDMFSIDITLILNFISVATTYLIVIIQISHFI
ncbi:uncharacterized protein LOC124634010 [Helicoverpa zea]|uniref:uncharacterized protein LOC124634010 n=1 Tax=Helicoverpa zea TaxID=7113 RepID=UPI001F574311|nr:uncharacterized protein LOC124634010 [Helicoverpa zea]